MKTLVGGFDDIMMRAKSQSPRFAAVATERGPLTAKQASDLVSKIGYAGFAGVIVGTKLVGPAKYCSPLAHVIRLNLNPGLLSNMATNDVASSICQALKAGHREGFDCGAVWTGWD